MILFFRDRKQLSKMRCVLLVFANSCPRFCHQCYGLGGSVINIMHGRSRMTIDPRTGWGVHLMLPKLLAWGAVQYRPIRTKGSRFEGH